MASSTSIFSSDQLSKVISQTLTDIPDDHKNAVVGMVDQNGARVAVGFTRKGKGTSEWTFQGAAEHAWKGDNSIGGKVILSW